MISPKKYLSRYLVIGLLITLTPSLTSAQENTPLWYDVRIIEVKAEREAEFQDLIAQVTSAMSAAGRCDERMPQMDRPAGR